MAAPTAPSSTRTDAIASALAGLLFAVALVHALWALGVGWHNGIYDAYAFRQTQTALSVHFMLEGGPLLAYETPVFGYPWTIPFEFPLYQWLVAGLVTLSGMPLEQAGRLVNAAFFLASLAPAWLIARRLGLSVPAALIACAVLLASPFYLFWSRTFMIESTALFLSLAYLALVLAWRRRPATATLLGAAAFGTLAALVKLTTFIGFLAAAGVVLGADVWRRRAWRDAAALRHYAIAAVALTIVPYGISQIWVAYCDALKMESPLTATYLTSKHLRLWVFGDWGQRASADTWATLWSRHPDWVGHWGVLAIAAAALAAARRYRGAALVALALALAVVLIFVNLHVIHDYYQYANVVLVLAAIGLALGGLIDAGGGRRIAGLVLSVLVIGLMLRGYGPRYYDRQHTDVRPYDALAARVREVVGPDDVVAIWGDDWSPALPYAARRRALMFIPYFDQRRVKPVLGPALATLRAHDFAVGGLVFCNHMREPERVAPRLALFPGFAPVPSDHPSCDLYAPLPAGAPGANGGRPGMSMSRSAVRLQGERRRR